MMLDGWSIPYLYTLFLVFIRTGALIFVIPIFESRSVPVMARLGFALLFSNVVAMTLPQPASLPLNVIGFVVAGISELTVGLFLGLIIKMAFQAVSLAGEIWSTEGNFMRDSSFDPMSNQPSSALERLLFNFAIVIFLVTGLHYVVLGSFVESFHTAPLGQWLPNNQSMMGFVAASSAIFGNAVQIAAPVIAVNFVINMTFSVLGKAAPQVNVFVISFPILISAGLFLLSMTLDVTGHAVIKYLSEAAKTMLQLVHVPTP